MSRLANNAVIVKIDVEGVMHFIWNDNLVPLLETGAGTIRRASHVEPTPRGLWGADLSPVDGPMLGPFRTRQEALDAERVWLNENYLGVSQ